MIEIKVGDATLFARITHYEPSDPSTGCHGWVEWELFDENGDRQEIAEQIIEGVEALFNAVALELYDKYTAGND